MEPRFEKWERIRAKGKTNYVLLYGVLLWGLFTAALFALVPSLLTGVRFSWVRALTSVILFPVGGIFFGHFTWTATEKAYQKAKSSEPGAALNGGPATRSGNSGVTGGSPSVT